MFVWCVSDTVSITQYIQQIDNKQVINLKAFQGVGI